MIFFIASVDVKKRLRKTHQKRQMSPLDSITRIYTSFVLALGSLRTVEIETKITTTVNDYLMSTQFVKNEQEEFVPLKKVLSNVHLIQKSIYQTKCLKMYRIK